MKPFREESGLGLQKKVNQFTSDRTGILVSFSFRQRQLSSKRLHIELCCSLLRLDVLPCM